MHNPLGKKHLEEAIDKIYNWIISNQTKEGTWPAPYDGPFFLLPLYVFAAYACKKNINDITKSKMSNYILKHQINDGSFGIHRQAKDGSLFCSILNYIALRFLGNNKEKTELKKCLNWIHEHGGPLYSANWTKFILSFLNLYSYKGVSPIPPELYLLPKWFPFHPRRISGYVRIIYLPMSYFYRKKFAIEVDELITSLREELYEKRFDQINFKKHKNSFAPSDNIVPETRLFVSLSRFLSLVDYIIPNGIKKYAARKVYNHIRYEDENSNYIRQAPVNAVYNTLIYHFLGKADELKKSWEKLPSYLWETENEVLMQGFTNTYIWDCGFYLSILNKEKNSRPDINEAIKRTRKFLLENQLTSSDELIDPEKNLRIKRAGGWPFSIKENGWPVSDCTAESIKSLLETDDIGPYSISDENIKKGITFILNIQNKDGGWASVDEAIGKNWLEKLNASNVFFDIMVDHSYVECTSSIIQSFLKIKKEKPHLYTDEIDNAVLRGYQYIINTQLPNGSWEAVWALPFIYGSCFALEALNAYGIPKDRSSIKRANAYLWKHQKKDGSWGEAQESAVARKYVQAESGNVDQTAWAVIGLLNGGCVNDPRLEKAINWLINEQKENGDWPEQYITGQFYRTTMINYPHYKRYFTLKALKMYQELKYGSVKTLLLENEIKITA